MKTTITREQLRKVNRSADLLVLDEGAAMKIKVLFLCTGNSCRSQMAEGWAKKLKGDEVEAYSAGLEKHGINKMAVQVMAEAGVDISRQESNLIKELPVKKFDLVVTLCGHASETCPYFPGPKIHVGFDDPPKQVVGGETEAEILQLYRKVRDEIKVFIQTLPAALNLQGGCNCT